jgi:hypothetical protein
MPQTVDSWWADGLASFYGPSDFCHGVVAGIDGMTVVDPVPAAAGGLERFCTAKHNPPKTAQNNYKSVSQSGYRQDIVG